jgi:hypothetical protein
LSGNVFEEDGIFDTGDGLLEGVSFEVAEENDMDLQAIRAMIMTDTNNYEADDGSHETGDSEEDSQDILNASDNMYDQLESNRSPKQFPPSSYLQSIYDTGTASHDEEQTEEVVDEWENDDDTGYLVISISSEDFFEMETVSRRCPSANWVIMQNFATGGLREIRTRRRGEARGSFVDFSAGQ